VSAVPQGGYGSVVTQVIAMPQRDVARPTECRRAEADPGDERSRSAEGHRLHVRVTVLRDRHTAGVTDGGRPDPGWYPDPNDTWQLRWWDGAVWSAHRAPRYATSAPRRGPRPVGEFIGAAFRALVASIRPLALLAVIAVLPLIVALLLADAQLGISEWFAEVLDVIEATPAGVDPVWPSWDGNGASLVIWGVAVFVLYLFAYIALPLASVLLIDGGLRDEATDVDAAVRLGLQAVPRALLVGGVALLGFGAIFLVPIFVTAMVPPLGVILLFGAVPLLVYLYVRLLGLYQPLVVIEGLGLAQFRRSWELTRGHFWALFGRLALFGLIAGLASNIVTMPIQLIGAVDPELATLLGFTIGMAAGAATGIVNVAAPIVLYRDLVDGPPPPSSPPSWASPSA
jgi:hypothetical protein